MFGTRSQNRTRFSHIDEAALRSVQNQGLTIAEQAKRLECSVNIIRQRGIKYGVYEAKSIRGGNIPIAGPIINTVWSRLTTRARNKNIPFDLTPEEAALQISEQNGLCTYTGLTLAFPKSPDDVQAGRYTASPDRIESAVGYAATNFQWIHKIVQIMKNSFSHGLFVATVLRIALYLFSKTGLDKNQFYQWCEENSKHGELCEGNYNDPESLNHHQQPQQAPTVSPGLVVHCDETTHLPF
jgi:hypothetical protein